MSDMTFLLFFSGESCNKSNHENMMFKHLGDQVRKKLLKSMEILKKSRIFMDFHGFSQLFPNFFLPKSPQSPQLDPKIEVPWQPWRPAPWRAGHFPSPGASFKMLAGWRSSTFGDYIYYIYYIYMYYYLCIYYIYYIYVLLFMCVLICL